MPSSMRLAGRLRTCQAGSLSIGSLGRRTAASAAAQPTTEVVDMPGTMTAPPVGPGPLDPDVPPLPDPQPDPQPVPAPDGPGDPSDPLHPAPPLP